MSIFSNPSDQPADAQATEQPASAPQQSEPAQGANTPESSSTSASEGVNDPRPTGVGVGDLVSYVVEDGEHESTRHGVVLELLDGEPDKDGKSASQSRARVVELPEAGVLDVDRLQKL